MARSDIKLVTAPRSAERAELALAIEHVSAADNSVAAVQAAVARAGEMVRAAADRLDAVKSEVETAKEAATTRLVSAASSGEALKPDASLRSARVKELEASDDLDAARDALALIEARLDDPQYDHRRAKDRLERAVEAVFVSEVDRLVEEVRAAQAVVAEKQAILQAIEHHVDGFRQLEACQKIKRGFVEAPFAHDMWRRSPAATKWLDARAALLHDADAELPK